MRARNYVNVVNIVIIRIAVYFMFFILLYCYTFILSYFYNRLGEKAGQWPSPRVSGGGERPSTGLFSRQFILFNYLY